MVTPPRVVYDCNIYVQALINLNGPAARCVELAHTGDALLFVSPFVLAEIRDIHEKLPSKYGVTAKQTEDLASYVISFATLISNVPEIYLHPFDPDDSHYVNLAVHTGSALIVSRDRHLLDLMDNVRVEARAFRQQFPLLQIIDPVAFLHILGPRPATEENFE